MKKTLILLAFFCSTKLFSQTIFNDSQEVKMIAKTIGDFNLIALGEFEHRKINPSKLKVALIKELHQNHRYDAIIFESSFSNNWAINQSSVTPKQEMTERLYPIWQTPEVLKLFEYNADNNGSIEFYGCDLKGYLGKTFTIEMSKALKKIDSPLSLKFEEVDKEAVKYSSEWEIDLKTTLQKSKAESMIEIYKSIISKVKKSNKFSEYEQPWIIHALLNRISLISFLNMINNENTATLITYRDRIMSENFIWLLNNPLKDKKVILWAADYHISKSQNLPNSNTKSMVELLPDSIKEKTYSLAIKPMRKANKSIKKLFNQTDSAAYIYVHKTDDGFSKKDIDVFDGMIYSKEWISNKRLD